MLLTTKVHIDNSHKDFKVLGRMCYHCARMYNVGLYSVRQHYFNTGEFLSYYDNYHLCKTNENLRQLSPLQDKRELLSSPYRYWTTNPQTCGQGYALVLRSLETEETGQIFQPYTFAQVQGQRGAYDLFCTRTFRKDKGWKGKDWINQRVP